MRRLLRQPGRLAALADRGQSKMCTGNVLSLSGVISLRRKFHPGSFRLAARSTMRREGEQSHRVALGDAEPCEHGSDATTATPTVLSTVFMPVATLVCSALTFSMIKLGIAVNVRP